MKSANKNPFGVKEGQVWESTDKRDQLTLSGLPTRQVKILKVDEDTGYARVLSNRGVKTEIRLTRFRPNSTGYRLVGEALE